jgi:hypothetical protein
VKISKEDDMSEELKKLLQEMAPHLSGLERAALFTAQIIGDAEAKEVDGKNALVLAQIEYEKMKAHVLDRASAEGHIDGANADTRKRQVAALLAGDGALRAQEEHIRSLDLTTAYDKVEVAYYRNVLNVLIEAVRREVQREGVR